MKAYELKALLSSLDDGAEVSIELKGPGRYHGDWPSTRDFDVYAECSAKPRSATLRVNPEDLAVISNAQERIEELEQQLDELKREVRSALGALGDMNAFREGCEIAKVLEELEELL